MPRCIVVDSDALVALFVSSDSNHQLAQYLLNDLEKEPTLLICPTTTVAETCTVLHKKLNLGRSAQEFLTTLMAEQFKLQEVTAEILQEALIFYQPLGRKGNTLFDAIVAVIAQQEKADAIFSFDHWYKKLGLSLLSEKRVG